VTYASSSTKDTNKNTAYTILNIEGKADVFGSYPRVMQHAKGNKFNYLNTCGKGHIAFLQLETWSINGVVP
jgi:hypothetical protein